MNRDSLSTFGIQQTKAEYIHLHSKWQNNSQKRVNSTAEWLAHMQLLLLVFV